MIGLLDMAAVAARRADAETAHRLAIDGLAMLGPLVGLGASRSDPILATRLVGLAVPSPIGLAAGFDKDARALRGLLAIGFGFVECGTVTPQPQPGNPRPRVFRLADDRAVINRYGFNSQGLERFARRLGARDPAWGVVGANIGANKDSSDRVGDYVAGLERVYPLADYVTVNISSPNTPGLRGLQEGAALDDLLARLGQAAETLAHSHARRPLLLKVAPDLDSVQIEAIGEAVMRNRFDALIVSNTTLARPESLRGAARTEAGGLSGRPLFAASTRVLAEFRAATGGRLPLIGAGGVEDGATAYAKIRAGASLVQLYTALAYAGPSLVGRIGRELAALLRADGFATVQAAVGVDAPV